LAHGGWEPCQKLWGLNTAKLYLNYTKV
jgi:predicted nucleic acid-binding Zn finger protein